MLMSVASPGAITTSGSIDAGKSSSVVGGSAASGIGGISIVGKTTSIPVPVAPAVVGIIISGIVISRTGTPSSSSDIIASGGMTSTN